MAAPSLVLQLEQAVVALEGFMETRHNYIPVMGWEQSFAGMIGLSIDQCRFMLALFASIPVGAAVRIIPPGKARHLYALILGFLLVYYPFGFGVIHAALPCTLVYLAVVLAPSVCGTVSWVICFPYLMYLHVMNASGHNWQLGLLDFTGCEMVLVLKLITFAVARQDHWQWKKKGRVLTAYQAQVAIESTPGPLEYLSYVFGLGNLLSGPYLEYVDYRDFIECRGLWDRKNKVPTPIIPALRCLLTACFYMALYQALIPSWNRETVLSEWYAQQNYVVKLLSCFLLSFTCQLKFVFAWKLSEASLSLAGLNFIGWDENTGKAEWGRYENVRFTTMLLSDSARIVVSHWNIGTSKFLRRYVYERLTPHGRKPGFPQLLVTQLVSAIWHGLYPGYLLFFAGSAFWLNFATVIHKAEQALLPQALQNSIPSKVLKILWTHLVLNYLATTFMLLELKLSLQVWGSLRYAPVLIITLGSFVGPMLLPRPKRPRAGKDDTSGGKEGTMVEGKQDGREELRKEE